MFGPNISGSVELESSSGAALLYADAKVSGAFSKTGSSNVVPNGVNSAGKHLAIDSSRNTSIFGGSTTVQPSAIRVLPCIKF